MADTKNGNPESSDSGRESSDIGVLERLKLAEKLAAERWEETKIRAKTDPAIRALLVIEEIVICEEFEGDVEYLQKILGTIFRLAHAGRESASDNQHPEWKKELEKYYAGLCSGTERNEEEE